MPQKGIVQQAETEGAASALPQARAGRPASEHAPGRVGPVINLYLGACGQNGVQARDEDRKAGGGQFVAYPAGERFHASELVATYPLEHSVNLMPGSSPWPAGAFPGQALPDAALALGS